MDAYHVAIDAVVDGKWESLGQATVVAGDDLVNACVEQQRVDVREQTIDEIRSQPSFLPLVEPKALD